FLLLLFNSSANFWQWHLYSSDSGIHLQAVGSTKDTASQEVKKDVSSLRYIALPNWAHDALLEFSSKPKKISDALQDPSWIEAIQEELLQFKIQKDERGIVIKNKAMLVAQGHTQEEGIDYDEVFSPVARIEAIRLFLAYASFMGFTVYQMDVKSAFLYGTIDEEVYVMQPPGFQDPEYPAKVYKEEKAIEFEALMHEKFQMSAMGELNFFLGLQVLQKEDDIFLSQDKYMGRILKKFRYSDVRTSNTPMDKENPWGKDGLWYPKESPFNLVAYLDSNYGGATEDRKSTTGGCQFLGRRLISWQYKKQTIIATSTTEAEYVAAASCCGHHLWIQNQLLDYGYNFMNTNIYIDNNSAICIVKNLVYHSKTKNIEIRHHFIKDCFKKKLINVDHIHTDENVADLLTKSFDAGRFQYLV
nr:putative reverse transcriptase, RNA-dependent DNA polymerase [Tanacetum cinerariifolium]